MRSGMTNERIGRVIELEAAFRERARLIELDPARAAEAAHLYRKAGRLARLGLRAARRQGLL
jgi:hypothetical protein